MQLLTFIETNIFTKAIKELFDDDEYRKIQNELLNDPQKGDLIQGTGGLRKIRFGRNSGKSSGVRILYYYTDEFIIIQMNLVAFICLRFIQNPSKIILLMLKKRFLKPLSPY